MIRISEWNQVHIIGCHGREMVLTSVTNVVVLVLAELDLATRRPELLLIHVYTSKEVMSSVLGKS